MSSAGLRHVLSSAFQPCCRSRSRAKADTALRSRSLSAQPYHAAFRMKPDLGLPRITPLSLETISLIFPRLAPLGIKPALMLLRIRISPLCIKRAIILHRIPALRASHQSNLLFFDHAAFNQACSFMLPPSGPLQRCRGARAAPSEQPQHRGVYGGAHPGGSRSGRS